MTTSDTAQRIAETIATLMGEKELSERGLSDKSGIPRGTLRRRLYSPTDFSIAELTRVADVLDVPFEQLCFGTRGAA